MAKNKDRVLLRIVKLTKPIAKWLLLGGILDLLAVICSAATPEILGRIIQLLFDLSDNSIQDNAGYVILLPLVKLFAVYASAALLGYLSMRLMNEVVSRYFSCNLRIMISDKIKRLPVRYVDQTPVGDILRRMTDDISEMGGYVHQVFDTAIRGIFQLLLITVAMFLADWRLALFVVVLTPFSLLLSSKIAAKSEKHYDAMFASSGKLTELVEEAFSNYPTTKAYNLEDSICSKHGTINAQLADKTVKANFTGSIVQPIIKLTNALAYICINLIGGFLVVTGQIGVGVVVAIVLYARQFASPLEQLSYGFSQLNRVKAASRRVFSILDMEEETDLSGSIGQLTKGDVVFDCVDFSYKPEEPLIECLELHVQPGQRIAIVGPTGAGKTTIVNLLMRFYDPDRGTIYLDGVAVNSLSRSAVRDKIGMVLQDTWLFRGTVAENVAYGRPDATRDEIVRACQKAHCDHFICTMPNGYDTIVGDDSENLSGGQKQLLTIARAILADKPILILDEATSNVDTRTEVLIQEAMDELMKGKTTFVIAHRLSTIVKSDRILVLNKGKVVEQGTHSSLLEQKGFYHRLYTSQYSI